MKLLFLSKRRPQGRDLINRPYGRFFNLPKILAEKGHAVHILLLSYKNDQQISLQKDGINWTSISLIKHGPLTYIREAEKIIKQTKPDWIVGFSDTYYGILAQRLADKNQSRSLIDAYDNYESYIPWLKPLHVLWRKSLSKATLVTAAGPSLADLLGKFRPGKPTKIIPMAADPVFQPMGKNDCRQMLGLPMKKKLIGYSGSTLVINRGLEILFNAFEAIKREIPDSELILTGRKAANISIPTDANWLGYLPDDDIPALLNSLDVLVVMNKPSSFGNYSYPAKLYEAMRCEVPVVVIETLSTKWIMRSKHELLVEFDSPVKLSEKIKNALNFKRVNYGKQPDWEEIGIDFEKLLL